MAKYIVRECNEQTVGWMGDGVYTPYTFMTINN